jgi:hypothetical protein
LGEDGLEGAGQNEMRMRFGCWPGVGERETEGRQNPPDDLEVLNEALSSTVHVCIYYVRRVKPNDELRFLLSFVCC